MAVRNYTPVTDLFKQSSQIVRRNLYPFIIINILTAVGVVWRIGLNVRDKTNGSPWHSIISNGVFGNGDYSYPGSRAGVFAILFVVASGVLSLMNVILTVRAARKKNVILAGVWQELTEKIWRLIGVILLVGLIVLVGLLLLIIPGIYFLGRLIMAPILLIDHNVGVREAINRSWDLTKGQMAPVYMVILFGLVLSLPNVIPIIGPIIAFVLTLLYSVALPLRYYELKSKA